MFEKFIRIIYRSFFICAFLVFFIALWDWIIRIFGWTLKWNPYQPGRMFEFSCIFMIFVIALLLRQIREGLKKPNTNS